MSYVTGNQKIKTDFSANGQTLVLDVASLNTARFEFSGTYSFTAQFESSLDGEVWFPLQVSAVNAATVATAHSTANATQAYEGSVHSVSKVRVRLSAFTSAAAHRVAIAGSVGSVEPTPVTQIAGTVSATTIPVSPTSTSVVTTASTNAAVVKSSAGTLFNAAISNVTATAVFVKFYNKSTAPTVGTDVPIITIPVPANSTVNFDVGSLGIRFSTGIGRAVTAAAPATDTGASVAGVQVLVTYV